MMTTQQVMAIAKKKFGRDITDKEAQDYLNGKTEIPDEALSVVSGGGGCLADKCPKCGSKNVNFSYSQGDVDAELTCNDCGYNWLQSNF